MTVLAMTYARPIGDRMNLLLERLHRRSTAYGTSLWMADPFFAEIIGDVEFDFVLIDTEHSAISPHQLQNLLIALRGSPAAKLIRTSSNDPTTIMQFLDFGADGVVVPHVETASECERAVRSTRYPPGGHRGFGPRRAARIASSRATYLMNANEQVLVFVMIESELGIQNLDEIVSVAGLSGVVIGPADLATSMGYVGEADHPDVRSRVASVADRCSALAVPWAIGVVVPEDAGEWVSRGANMVMFGSDLLFLEHGLDVAARDVGALRARMPAPSFSDEKGTGH